MARKALSHRGWLQHNCTVIGRAWMCTIHHIIGISAILLIWLQTRHHHAKAFTSEPILFSTLRPHVSTVILRLSPLYESEKVSSLYAGANTLLCRHRVAKTCSLSISTALALVVGVCTGLNLSLFINTSSWKAKSGSLPSPTADFALDNCWFCSWQRQSVNILQYSLIHLQFFRASDAKLA